ncbi:MAG: hypothetical protein H7644_04360 [Candidatus Heimdallarchaeota archaeon]|nr:hypothetical protein [Candidatus Heimdallarchaeota archaeon]MCK5142978.1 hypothetical protein [Candidatus Heimdallarchaeota archaeon]
MSVRSIMCPNCAAPLELESTQSHVTCPYCSVTSELKKVTDLIEHYMLPVVYDVEQIRTELVGDILKYPGAPEDLHKSLKITKLDLKFYPYYIVTVHLRTEYKGNGEYATFSNRYKSGYRRISTHLKPEQGVFDDTREFIIYAAEEAHHDLINFEISTRGKRYFQALEAEKVKADVVPSIFDLDQAKNEATHSMREIHKGLMLKELAQILEVRDQPEIKGVYLLHIPFYFIEFEAAGKKHNAILDGATGRTVLTDVPRETSYWIQVGFLTTIFAAIGLAGIYLAVQSVYTAYFGIFGAIAGLILAGRTLQLGLKSRHRETQRSKKRRFKR